MLKIAALAVLALVVTGWLWLLTRSISRLRAQIAEAESRLARRFYTLQGRVTEMGTTVSELDFEARRARGEIRFDPSMKLSEAFSIHPRVREIFAALGVSGGGCSGPTLDEERTIAEVCAEASLDSRVVMDALDRFLRAPSDPIVARPEAKIYRIGRIGTDD